jgi:hypothetical protein
MLGRQLNYRMSVECWERSSTTKAVWNAGKAAKTQNQCRLNKEAVQNARKAAQPKNQCRMLDRAMKPLNRCRMLGGQLKHRIYVEFWECRSTTIIVQNVMKAV